MNADELVRLIRADLTGTLIALDFDGTLAPIVTDPEQARPLPGTVETLAELAGRGVSVAVITGREAELVVRLGGLDAIPGLVVAGLYGAQTWTGAQLTSPPVPAVIEVLRERLPAALEAAQADPDLWIEDKGLSLVVHARRTADPVATLDGVRGAVSDLAAKLELDVHPGRDVLEVRLPGYDKGTALRRLVDEAEPQQLIFAGDDLGDLPAFAEVHALRQRGLSAWSVGVLSEEVPELGETVDVGVPGPAGMRDLLQQIAD